MTSMRALAKERDVSDSTVRLAVADLGLKSYVRRERQLLTTVGKEKRFRKGKALLSWLKGHGGVVKIFTDEKNWTVDQARNARNDRFLTTSPANVPPSCGRSTRPRP